MAMFAVLTAIELCWAVFGDGIWPKKARAFSAVAVCYLHRVPVPYFTLASRGKSIQLALAAQR